MKKNLLIFGLVIAFYLLLPTTKTQAHPGNTDSSGGHTCRTNCTSWGLEYGQYHFHNRTSYPSFSYPSYTPPAPTITVKSFLVSKVFEYDKIVIADSSDYYIVTTGYGCFSTTFYEGQTIYIDTYSSPSYFDDIYTSTSASSKKCSITNSEKVNLKAYYVDSVIDSKYNIIVSDKNNDSYLVEYGIGCLSMWRVANKTIYIDIGGTFLDGVGDKIYLFDYNQSCSVWDADNINTYTPTYIPPTLFYPTPTTVVPVAPQATLTASKTSIGIGESVILSWTSSDATTLSIDSGIGSVNQTGSKVISPLTTTIYTLTANGPGGKTLKSVIISVVAPTPTATPTISATTQYYDFKTTLKLGSKGAEIQDLQNFLVSRGFLKWDKNTVKSTFGTTTKNALIKYQKSKKIKATGILDSNTRDTINGNLK